MSTYNINFSDPLRAGFAIAQGGFNGPGGASVSSPLRLYGRGALEWGESVDENMLRTLENFNGATPPPFALAGQLWFQTKFYWLETGVTWWRYDPDVTNTWIDIGPTGTAVVSGGVVGTNITPPLVIGTYWYTAGAPIGNDAFGEPLKPTTLYLYEQYGPPGVAAGWLERTNSEPAPAAAPINGVDFPERGLVVRDEFIAAWTPAVDIGAIGGLLADGTIPMSGDLDMDTSSIINLADPINPQDAMTLFYADANYLRLDATNDPMTAHLDLFGVQTYPDLVNLARAASTNYVNTAIAAVGTPTSGSNGFATTFITAGPYTAPGAKQGDIAVDGTRAWIKITAGFILTGPTNFGVTDGSDANWKQVFPALYS